MFRHITLSDIRIIVNWFKIYEFMVKNVLILASLLLFSSPNLFPGNERHSEKHQCYYDSDYFRAKAQSIDDSAHNLILLVNALNEIVEMKMVNITVLEGKNSLHTKTGHTSTIGNYIMISSEMNNVIRMDDQFAVEFLAYDYTIGMDASIMSQNIIYNEHVTT